MILRVAWRLAVELTKMADVVECHRRLSEYLVVGIHRLGFRQVEDGPEQHRGMAVRQHKPVAIGPDGILRIETEYAIPKRIDEWRQGHRRTRVSGLGLLNGINRERTNCVDA